LQDNAQPPIKTIITEWIDSYDGKLSKDSDEKKLALEQLVDTFLKYGYGAADIKSATTRKWVLEECCPSGLKGKVRDYSTWYHLTDRLWGRVLRARFPEIELADKRPEPTLPTAKVEKSESDIPKETPTDPEQLDHGNLDRSKLKIVPQPEAEWNKDMMDALGVDPSLFGMKSDE
jgi:hypothetical protein